MQINCRVSGVKIKFKCVVYKLRPLDANSKNAFIMFLGYFLKSFLRRIVAGGADVIVLWRVSEG
jgi:hypothetical protein